MQTLVLSILFFSACYFSLRYAKLLWETQQLQSWTKYFLGVVAWGVVVGGAGILAGVAEPIIGLFQNPNMGHAFQIGGIALGATAILSYANANPELFDFDSMRPFLKECLLFSNPARSRENLTELLDKHEVRKVYREVTGRDLIEESTQNKPGARFIPGRDEVVKGSPAVMDLLKPQPIASPHLAAELASMKRGTRTDVTDSWKINALKSANHPWYSNISLVLVDPAARRIEVTVESQDFSGDKLREAASLYRFKQTVYEFMLAVHELDWTKPYLTAVSVLEVLCKAVEVEPFEGTTITPLLKAEISLKELAHHAAHFFNAGELKAELLI